MTTTTFSPGEAPGTSAAVIAAAVVVPIVVIIGAIVAFGVYKYKQGQVKKKLMRSRYDVHYIKQKHSND